MKSVGKRIKGLRTDRGLTQPQVADRIKRKQQSVSDLETGKSKEPDALTLVRLAKLFDVDAEWLLTGEGPPQAVQSITHDESELLLLFRALSPAGQQYLLSRARALHQDEHSRRKPGDDEQRDEPERDLPPPSH